MLLNILMKIEMNLTFKVKSRRRSFGTTAQQEFFCNHEGGDVNFVASIFPKNSDCKRNYDYE